MSGRADRLVVSHGLSAIAMAMPWPALLALVWSETSSELWLAVTGAARMAPYVLLSWAAGALGDRYPRVAVVKVSTALRLGLLVATAVLLSADQISAAVVAATLTVAVGTPAYPALAAAMPALAGTRSDVTTRWLVTLEVSAFVVGPAVGGLLLGIADPATSVWAAVAIAAVGLALLPVDVVAAVEPVGQVKAAESSRSGAIRTLVAAPTAVGAIVAVAVVNGVIGALGVGLLSLATDSWSAGPREFGLATAALGFGALATPAVCRVVRLPTTAIGGSLLLTALPLAAAAVVPTWLWALPALALVGAGATQVECAVTAVVQQSVPDHARAFALGLTDTAMVSVALLGAATAPSLASALGPRGMVLALVTVTGAAAALLARPSRAPSRPPVRTPAPYSPLKL